MFVRAQRSDLSGYRKIVAGVGFTFTLCAEWNPLNSLYGNGNFVETLGEANGDIVQGFAGLQPYLNAVPGAAIAGGGGPAGLVYIGGGYNSPTTCEYPYFGYIKALAIYSCTLSGAEVTGLTAAMMGL